MNSMSGPGVQTSGRTVAEHSSSVWTCLGRSYRIRSDLRKAQAPGVTRTCEDWNSSLPNQNLCLARGATAGVRGGCSAVETRKPREEPAMHILSIAVLQNTACALSPSAFAQTASVSAGVDTSTSVGVD